MRQTVAWGTVGSVSAGTTEVVRHDFQGVFFFLNQSTEHYIQHVAISVRKKKSILYTVVTCA